LKKLKVKIKNQYNKNFTRYEKDKNKRPFAMGTTKSTSNRNGLDKNF